MNTVTDFSYGWTFYCYAMYRLKIVFFEYSQFSFIVIAGELLWEGDEWKNVGRREAILHRRRAVFPVVVCNFQEIKSRLHRISATCNRTPIVACSVHAVIWACMSCVSFDLADQMWNAYSFMRILRGRLLSPIFSHSRYYVTPFLLNT